MRIGIYPFVNILKDFLTKLMDVAGTGTGVQLPSIITPQSHKSSTCTVIAHLLAAN